MRYREISHVVEARQVPKFDRDEAEFRDGMNELAKWTLGQVRWSRVRPISVSFLGGQNGTVNFEAQPGDWIIFNEQIGFGVVRENIFQKRFEEIEE